MPLLVVLLLLLALAPAAAMAAAPWDASPISQGLGPTYGEPWPVPIPAEEAAIAARQTAPLALMPYAGIKPYLDQFQAEAIAAGVPARMTYSVLGKSAQGRDIYGVVINAMETEAQRRDYARWQTFRSMMMTDPIGAQALLDSWGSDVKMCVYQSHIHGNEYEAVDSNMQVIRDLTVTPRGVNTTVDKILDNSVVVVLMDNNPDGRVNGTRGNPTGLDPNRDFFVQSQPEQKIAVAYMHQWMPTGFIEGHGYYTPTLIDGTTIPHNPGMEADLFQTWNVQRIEQNRADFAADGVTGLTEIQSPIRDWNETGGTSTTNYTVAGTPYTIAAGPSGIANSGGAAEVGNTVTITTSTAHNLAVGYSVTISGVTVTGYNGTWTVASIVSPTKFTYTNPTSGLLASGRGTVACAAINGASESGTTATITTTAANTLVVGDTVNVGGVSVAGYNGTFTVASIVSPTQFTYTNPTSGLASSGGGGVTSPSVAATATGATEAGNTVTITTTASSILAQGYKVVISGVLEAGYNGTFKVDSVISATQFTYTNPTSGLAGSGGGNVALPPQPNLAQSWDDWGPFYGQSYSALLGGPDGSTVEMTSASRLLSKQAQYVAFYSSNNFWADHKASMMSDHLVAFRRGVTDAAPDPQAFDNNPVLSSRYYSDVWQNYMVSYPKAYVIPWDTLQRSDSEANNLVVWLLRNGIQVTKATSDFTWNGNTYLAGSYVVWMNQALRGLAWNALSAGTDISGTKITTLYATPAAWSHALSWGADVVEIPRGDATFTPTTSVVTAPSTLVGGVRDGVEASSDWYSVALKGVHEYPALRSLLNAGIKAQMAEASFVSTTGGTMPAGTLIFPASAKAALDVAGKDAGIWFERNLGVTMPPTTGVTRVPKIAVLVATVPTTESETSCALDSIFSYDATGQQQSVRRLVTSSDWEYVATNTSTGTGLNNSAIADPLLKYDVIYTTLTAWPSAATYPTASARLTAFFARGGGFMTQNVSSAGFLTGAPSPLVTGTLTRGSSSAYGGTAMVNNVGSVTSPISGPQPSIDTLFLPSNVFYYSAIPTGAVVDQQYPSSIATIGVANGFVAGLWNNRDAAVNNAPVLIHGNTTVGSRYMFYNTNAFSRLDGQRQWQYFVQTALWSNQTDEITTTDNAPSGWQRTPVTVTLTPVDNGSATINHIYYKVDDAASYTEGTLPTTSVLIPAPSDGSNNGTHTITYYATDDAGHTEVAHSSTVKIEVVPTVFVSSPNSGSFTKGTSSTVSWNISSAVSSGSFRVWLKNTVTNAFVRVTPAASPVAAVPGETAYSVPWNITQAVGTYRVYVYYYDADGTTVLATDGSDGTIDIQLKPTPTITTPNSGSFTQGTASTVSWSMNYAVSSGSFRVWLKDTVTGAFVRVTPAASPVAAAPGETAYSVPWNVTQPAGTYKLWVYYYAADGSVSSTAVSSGVVSIVLKPTPAITSPNSGTLIRGSSTPVIWSMSTAVSTGSFRVWLKNTVTNAFVRVTPAASPIMAQAGKTTYSVPWFVTQPAGTYKLWIYYYLANGTVSTTAVSSGTITLL